MATNFAFRVPDDQEAGAYSNILVVWHTPYEFTFDFGVMLPVQQDPSGDVTVPARVVARVKIPPSRISDILKAMTENLQRYEAQFGPVPQPSQGTLNIEIPDDISSLFPTEDENEEDE
jgi:hypothetical protein